MKKVLVEAAGPALIFFGSIAVGLVLVLVALALTVPFATTSVAASALGRDRGDVGAWALLVGGAALGVLVYLGIVALVAAWRRKRKAARGAPISAPAEAFPFDRVGRQVLEPKMRYRVGDGEVSAYHLTVFQQRWFARVRRKYGVAVVRTDHASPYTQIWPEGATERAAQAVGLGDLDVESHEFNRRWSAYARDAAESYHVLTPRVIDLFAGDLPAAVYTWAPGAIVVAAPRGAADVAAMAGAAGSLAPLLPGTGAGAAPLPPARMPNDGSAGPFGKRIAAIALATLIAAGAYAGGVVASLPLHTTEWGELKDNSSAVVALAMFVALPALTFGVPTLLGWLGSRAAERAERSWRR